ncbi:MAG TPA: AAA family ATPase [Kofleriaceae bacterium]|jgi:uridine kinase
MSPSPDSAPGGASKPILTIDGIDGSGKSTFARTLAERLGAVILRVDDYRRHLEWSSGTESELYYDHYYDLAACGAALAAFASGAASIDVPIFHNQLERVTGHHSLDLSAPVAILEGVFPLRIPEARAFLIYLDTSPETARARILARDLAKGRTPAEIRRRIDLRYAPAQARYHAAFAPRDHARVIIDNEDPSAPRVLRRDVSGLPPVIASAL